ncbi:hypothetical protein [Campylobacter fetus]|uniref:hypothetical protein n=1 Tax=Campylobacter fetus TaxID=196 RepID=UPI000CFD38F4|nr:hypothetical protein [Campylobacter fetus]AVK80557.1 hypothetical protein C6B32_01485 [Campylobacter fetus subsp. testudinum]
MVKSFFAFLIFASICFGYDLSSNLKSIVGDQIYNANQQKIKSLFINEAEFVDANSNLNYDKITNILRTNSFLNLSYASPVYMDISFVSSSSPTLVLKAISQSLNNLGYNYFLTKSLDTWDSGMVWSVSINTQFMLNPGSFYKELLSNNIFIKNIKKTGQFAYSYEIDANRAILKTLAYESDTEVQLSKPLEPYFLNVSGKSSVEIKSRSNDSWIVLVKILDKNLKLISQVKSDKKEKEIYLDLPDEAFYLIIDDAFSLENIKHGLTIYIKSN